MNQINILRQDIARIRNILIFLVLNPIFFTFATVMCDFLNRDRTPENSGGVLILEKQEMCETVCS